MRELLIESYHYALKRRRRGACVSIICLPRQTSDYDHVEDIVQTNWEEYYHGMQVCLKKHWMMRAIVYYMVALALTWETLEWLWYLGWFMKKRLQHSRNRALTISFPKLDFFLVPGRNPVQRRREEKWLNIEPNERTWSFIYSLRGGQDVRGYNGKSIIPCPKHLQDRSR